MTDTDPLAEAIEEAFPNRGRRIAALIRSGALAPYLADVPAEALGFEPIRHEWRVNDGTGRRWKQKFRPPKWGPDDRPELAPESAYCVVLGYRRRSPEDSP